MVENLIPFYLDWSFWNVVVLTITLVILIWYTIETHRIAKQSIETNLRPIILRSNYIDKWEDIKYKKINGVFVGTSISFAVLKNIATSINGFIIINKYQYPLLFGCQISTSDMITKYEPNWGWMKPDNLIYAIFDKKRGIKTLKPNQIVINYSDVEGNIYHTIEDINWNQKTHKGKIV
jgi:hypothetical protein